jgi:hypothetical protein
LSGRTVEPDVFGGSSCREGGGEPGLGCCVVEPAGGDCCCVEDGGCCVRLCASAADGAQSSATNTNVDKKVRR